MVLWTKQNVLSLIKDYSKNKLLWDWFDQRYNNKEERKKTLEKLAEKYGTDVPTVKAKLNTLRSSFFQENKRIKQMIAAKMSYKPWYAYKDLQFLTNYKVRPPYTPIALSPNNHLSPIPTTSRYEAYGKEPNVKINFKKYDGTTYTLDNNKNDHAKLKKINEEHGANWGQNVVPYNNYYDHDENEGENVGDGAELEDINEEDVEVAAIIPDIDHNAIEAQPAQQENKPGHRTNENSSFGKYIGKEIEKLSPSTQMFTKCVMQYAIYEAFSGRLKDNFNANQPSGSA